MSDVDIRVTRARSQLVRRHPFFGSLAMRLRIQEWAETANFRTMATDGQFMYYCKSFLDRVSEVVLLFTVAHEVLHCALGHHVRRGNRDHDMWNIACDYVVNWMLHLAGFKVPDWAYLDPAFAGLNAEEVYRVLDKRKKEEEKERQKQQQQQQTTGGDPDDEDDDDLDQSGEDSPQDFDEDEDEGEDECESNDQDGSPEDSNSNGEQDGGTSATSPAENASDGAGGASSDDTQPEGDGTQSGSSDGSSSQSTSPPSPDFSGDPGGCGEILDAAPPHDKAALAEAADEWQVYTRQAVNIARRQGAGNLPGFAEEIIETLATPQTDWRDVLRRWVDPMTSTKDYTWTMPNRRYSPLGFYTPGMISDGINHVGLLIDSSGSINTPWLQKFGSEAQDALDNGAIDKVTVIFADDIVQHVAEYSKGDVIDFTVRGRGGTAFSPTFDYLEKNVSDMTVAIYFTDLDCYDFGPEPLFPVLWAVYGDDPRMVKANMSRVPWGECVELA